MTEQTRPANLIGRTIGIVASTLVLVVFILLSIWSWTTMYLDRSFEYKGKPFWIGALIVTFVAFCSVVVTWKLFYTAEATEGAQRLPSWFIRLFGIFLFVMLSAGALLKDSIFFMIGAALVGLPMILSIKDDFKRQKG